MSLYFLIFHFPYLRSIALRTSEVISTTQLLIFLKLITIDLYMALDLYYFENPVFYFSYNSIFLTCGTAMFYKQMHPHSLVYGM